MPTHTKIQIWPSRTIGNKTQVTDDCFCAFHECIILPAKKGNPAEGGDLDASASFLLSPISRRSANTGPDEFLGSRDGAERGGRDKCGIIQSGKSETERQGQNNPRIRKSQCPFFLSLSLYTGEGTHCETLYCCSAARVRESL